MATVDERIAALAEAVGEINMVLGVLAWGHHPEMARVTKAATLIGQVRFAPAPSAPEGGAVARAEVLKLKWKGLTPGEFDDAVCALPSVPVGGDETIALLRKADEELNSVRAERSRLADLLDLDGRSMRRSRDPIIRAEGKVYGKIEDWLRDGVHADIPLAPAGKRKRG